MKKKSNLELLQEMSGKATKILTDTIDLLKQTNADIENEKTAIAEKISALQAEDKSLSDLSAKNACIVSNFEALLS